MIDIPFLTCNHVGMMPQVTEEKLREAAAGRILSRRDELLREQAEIKSKQADLAARERELDRELAECRAAARFFNLDFDPPVDEAEIANMRARSRMFRQRADEIEARGAPSQEVAMLRARAADFERRIVAAVSAPPKLPGLEVWKNTALAQVEQSVLAISPTPPKIPRVRDIILDQLKEAGASGQKAAPIQKYIESTYSTKIHGKTVGMTLYRLSQEKLVYRKGQTWFYGHPVTETVLVESENPGVVAPGPINAPSE